MADFLLVLGRRSKMLFVDPGLTNITAEFSARRWMMDVWIDGVTDDLLHDAASLGPLRNVIK